MNKIFTKEVKIAIVAIAAVAALYFGMNFLKGLTVFSNTTTYRLSFTDLKGLSNSTPIYASGYKIGTVTGINYDYDNHGDIIVEAEIDPKMRIPEGSTANIESDLMGNIKVSLMLGTDHTKFIEAGGIIPGDQKHGAMEQFSAMAPTVNAMIQKLDSITTSLNMILSDPAIVKMLHNAETVSANLTTSTAELNKLMSTLNESVPGMMTKADKTLDNTVALTDNLASVDVNGTMAKVNKTLENVERMTAAINNGEGSLGMLLYDKGLYNNLNATMRDADSLVVDLKSHPKRYVHFSVFGKKDK